MPKFVAYLYRSNLGNNKELYWAEGSDTLEGLEKLIQESMPTFKHLDRLEIVEGQETIQKRRIIKFTDPSKSEIISAYWMEKCRVQIACFEKKMKRKSSDREKRVIYDKVVALSQQAHQELESQD